MALRQSAQGSGGYVPPVGNVHGGNGSFETDTHTMVTAQQYVSHVGQIMTSEVNKLMSNLEGTLAGKAWDSPAAKEFLKARTQWHSAHQHLLKALGDIEQGLGTSAKHYDQSDLDSSDGIGNAVSGLNYSI
jgi:uncharacterized protein YukE